MLQRKKVKMACNNAGVPWEVVWMCKNMCSAMWCYGPAKTNLNFPYVL